MTNVRSHPTRPAGAGPTTPVRHASAVEPESSLVDRRATSPRRRPAVVVAVVLAAAALCFAPRVGSAFGSVPASAPERGPGPASYVVQPGDTLWSIARRYRPEGDVRPLVDRLERQHHGARLHVGERLVIES